MEISHGGICDSPTSLGGPLAMDAYFKCCEIEQKLRMLTSEEEKDNANEILDSYEDDSENEIDYDIDETLPMDPPRFVPSLTKPTTPVRIVPTPSQVRFKSEQNPHRNSFNPSNKLTREYNDLQRRYPNHKIFIKTNKYGQFEFKVECRQNHGCESDCEIVGGRQKCICPEGSILASDNKSCCRSIYEERKTRDEEYACPHGQFKNDMDMCENINECKIKNNACGYEFECVNTLQSFYCIPKKICRRGFEYDERRMKCVGEF
jgi:hypothetical protein